MREVYVVAARRTAIAKQGGALRNLSPETIASVVLRAVVQDVQLSVNDIEEVILGNVVGPGGNIARLSLLTAGFATSIPGVTVDLQCGSGLQAIHQAIYEIRCGQRDIVIAGGVESSSRAPWKIEKPFDLYRGTGPTFFSKARFSPAELCDPGMGLAAENIAQRYGVSRQEQDEFALQSHQKAVAARGVGSFTAEITPISLSDGVVFAIDEGPREHTSQELLANLSPAFLEHGTVTAGNACAINDGAAVVIVAAKDACVRLGLHPVLRYVDSQLVGVDPRYPGMGPVPAVRSLLERCKISINDMDMIEINEAFAAQVLACARELAITPQQLNVCGGALAFGHPYGASGAILLTRIFHELPRRQGRFALATLGIGGGLGIASVWERVAGDEN